MENEFKKLRCLCSCETTPFCHCRTAVEAEFEKLREAKEAEEAQEQAEEADATSSTDLVLYR